MATFYDYVLAVWLQLEAESDASELRDQLREHLKTVFQVTKLDLVDDLGDGVEGEITLSMQLQVTFAEDQMDGDDPTEEALGDLGNELESHIKQKYSISYFMLLDDSPTSFLLAEWEDDSST